MLSSSPSSSSSSSSSSTLQNLSPDLSHIKAYTISVPGIDQSIEFHTLTLPKALYLWCNVQPSMTMGDFTIAVPGIVPTTNNKNNNDVDVSSASNAAAVPLSTVSSSSSSPVSSIPSSATILYTSGQIDKDEQESFAKLLSSKLKTKIIYLSYNIPEAVPIDARMDLQRAILTQITSL